MIQHHWKEIGAEWGTLMMCDRDGCYQEYDEDDTPEMREEIRNSPCVPYSEVPGQMDIFDILGESG